MKRSKLILLSAAGVAAIAAIFVVSPSIFNKNGAYQKSQLSFLEQKSVDDAGAWMAARYFDPTTGERITNEKLRLIDKAIKSMPTPKALPIVWEELGPDNIGGRTRAIVIDRTNINRIWAGSTSGGLYVSTNKAVKWSRVESYPGSKGINSMTQLQNGTLIVGTGISWSGDQFAGDGAWYSSDFGATWTLVPGTGNLNVIASVDNGDNSNTVWMATDAGVRRWTFGDATSSVVTSPSGLSRALSVSKDGNVIVVASGASRTWVSTDAGASFVDKSGSASGNVPVGAGRIEYAISPTFNSTGQYTIYAVRTNSNLLGMDVSKDNGQTWSQFLGPSGSSGNLVIYRDQGIWNSTVSVDPADPERIFVGGIDVWSWKQTSTGSSAPFGGIAQLSNWFVAPSSPIYVHADNHEFKWDANDRLYIGNDGGIGISNNKGTSFFPSNRGYNVTQFYGVAFDNNGAVLGGTQDNGSLYNDYSLSTFQEFRELTGGDGMQSEISFFNSSVMFTTSQFGRINRSGNRGSSFTSFLPPYPTSYTGLGTSGAFFPFFTSITLAETFDLNSEDTVIFGANKDYVIGDVVRVPSLSTGDTINYVTTQNLYFDAVVVRDTALTQTRVSIVDQITGSPILLGNFNYTPFASASGQNPPVVGDSLLVTFPTGLDTVVVLSTSSYTWNFARNSVTNKIIELGQDTSRLNVSWDTIRVADPFQSWFLVYVNTNGGELWGTRDALRLADATPTWVIIARNVGGTGNDLVDIEFSKDLNRCYIAVGSNVHRIDGLGSVYTSDPNFVTKAGLTTSGNVILANPTGTTRTTAFTGGVNGIALNPTNSNDLIVFPPVGPPRRSLNAGGAAPTYTTLGQLSGTNSPFIYDGIIDRDDSDIIVLGTSSGAFVSDNGGSTWLYTSGGAAGFEGTPVYEVRQSWRTFQEGNNRPGEIYLATHGRGMWRTTSLLNVSENGFGSSKEDFKTKLKTYPNPTSSSSTLSFNLEKSGNVDIQVYSISGQKMRTIQAKNLSKGENILDIEAENLPRGTYIVKFNSGNQNETTKFIKM